MDGPLHPQSSRAAIARPAAFTLLEILIVLLLMAVLSTVVAVSLAGTLRSASVEQAISQIRFADRAARQTARESGRDVRLVIRSGEGSIVRSQEGLPTATVVRLANPAKLERARDATTIDSPGLTIDYSPQGHSHSFAVLITGPAARRQWLIVAGLTGATTTTENDLEVDDIFSRLTPPRAPGRNAR
jgi:prepilin-type N-terminal cleavage/methylation domain-containing protein